MHLCLIIHWCLVSPWTSVQCFHHINRKAFMYASISNFNISFIYGFSEMVASHLHVLHLDRFVWKQFLRPFCLLSGLIRSCLGLHLLMVIAQKNRDKTVTTSVNACTARSCRLHWLGACGQLLNELYNSNRCQTLQPQGSLSEMVWTPRHCIWMDKKFRTQTDL